MNGNGTANDTAHSLVMVTIYEKPRDYPNHFVARRHIIADGKCTADPEIFYKGDTLAEVRAALPQGMFNLGRLAGDEPQIVETWV